MGIHAQDVNQTSKNEVIKIKKDTMYLYGEGVAETDSVSEKLAEQRFSENLSQYIKSIPSLASADVVAIPPIKKVTKKISFDRTAKRKVVFLYVKKSEILPVLTGEKSYVVDTTQPEVTEKPKPRVKTTEKPKEIATTKPKVSVSIDKEVSVGVKPKFTVTESPKETATIPSQELSYKDMTIKESGILQEILDLQYFDKIREYIILRKSTKHDILFRATNDFNAISDPGYWMVFNKEKELIAIVGKDKKSIHYNKQAVSLEDLAIKAKIWLSIK